MASSSLLPALWVHKVRSPPELVPPPPLLGALPPQPASTSTAASATTLADARGLGLRHLTIGSSAPRPGRTWRATGDRGNDRLCCGGRPPPPGTWGAGGPIFRGTD